MRPDNLQLVSEHQRQDGHTSPSASAWNRAKIEVSGDEVLLSVDGKLVHRRRIVPSNDHAFGLFHFADHAKLEFATPRCVARGGGTTSAVWEDITLRAEEMMRTPVTEPPSTL